MRTRCPACATVFRVTSEQLRVKAGKVRCGHCQHVFNAFDHLLDDKAPDPLGPPTGGVPAQSAPQAVVAPLVAPQPPAQAIRDLPVAELPQAIVEAPTEAARHLVREVALETDQEPQRESGLASGPEAGPDLALPPVVAVGETPMPATIDPVDQAEASASTETPEQSTLAAREAGLVALRELNESPAYNRWGAGALVNEGFSGFDAEAPRGPVWPYALAASLLALVLVFQLIHHFRTEISTRLPTFSAVFKTLGVDVPLPQDPALVSIETSELQFDNARGLFVLTASLKNRAAYAQRWPALELTLTDINDAVLARRVITAAEYLPADAAASPRMAVRFPARGELAVNLWIEARNLPAAGYRLYVFYP